MKASNKIRLDRLLAQPAARAANALARVLGRVLNRDHSAISDRVRVVAVAKFAGMGSIVQATPLLRALRRKFPKARIVFVTSETNRALLEHVPDVDEVVTVSERSVPAILASSVGAVVRLLRLRPDVYLDLEIYSAFACIVALASLARLRVGFYRASTRFKAGICTHLVYFNTQRPVRELYMQLGRAIGVGEEAELELPPLRVGDEARARFAQTWPRLAGTRADRPHVVVNPNASDLLVERRWPAPLVRDLVESLVARGHPVALTGAPSERAYVANVIEGLSEGARRAVVDTAGELDVGGLLALLESAACVVSNDTGPMHMAIGLGRPTVCLFGPCDPRHYGSPGPGTEILYEDVLCSPCVHHTETPPCAGDNVCMKRIAPPRVLDAVERLLADPQAATGPAPEPIAPVSESGRVLGLVVRDSVLIDVAPCPCCANRRFRFHFRREGLRVIRCTDCGLERLDPAPETAGLYDRDYYAAWGLDDEPEAARRMKHATFQRLLGQLGFELASGARVLDCGAATGFFMEVAERAGYQPHGVELSAFGAAEIAKRFGADRAWQGQLQDAALEPASFEAIFMLDFLEHVADPRGTLAQARELLAPGGHLVITTPDTHALTARLMGDRWSHYKVEHLYYFSRRNLPLLLRDVGFEVTAVRRAEKALPLDYVHHQMQTYPHPWLTPLVSAGYRLLPEGLRERPWPVSVGEMRVEARRTPSGA